VAPGNGRGSAHGRGSGSIRREAEQRSRAECQRKKKREGGPKDWFAKIEKSRDLTVN
jgi:hypothetical protein